MGRRLALLVGSSTYADPKLRRLHKPHADVASLASVLRDPTIGGFDEVQTNVDASVATLQRAVAALFAHKHTDDLLLLYFAGHGIKDEYGHLHLAAVDTESDLLNATALSSDFITREMDRSRSRKQILILDCCFSGAFSGTRGPDSVGTTQAFTTDGVGRVILTATDAFQYAWEDETAITDTNSLFTHYLVEGIRSGNADINGDGIITADEWYEFVYTAVRTASPKQTPQRSVHSGAGGLVIARNPRPKMPLPDEIAVAIRSPLPYVREGVAHELARLIMGDHAGLAATARDELQLLASDRDQRVRDIARSALLDGVAIEEEASSTARDTSSSRRAFAAVEPHPIQTKSPPPQTPAPPTRPATMPERTITPVQNHTAGIRITATEPFDSGLFVFIYIVVAVVLEAAIFLIGAASGLSFAQGHAWIAPIAAVLLLLVGFAIRSWRRYRAHPERGVHTVVLLLILAVLLGLAAFLYARTSDGVTEGPPATDTATAADTSGALNSTTVSTTDTTATATATDTNETTTSGTTNAPPNTATNESLTPLPTTNYSELVAELHTGAGEIDIRFFPDVAPNHVKNFVGLAQRGFYDGTKFFFVIPGIAIQGGDPNSRSDDRSTWGLGGFDTQLKDEFSRIPYTRGIVGIARRKDGSDTVQFFIMIATNDLDKQYTVLGKVTQGMSVVDDIALSHCDAAKHPDNPTTIEKITFRAERFKH
jgi:cyclophilin family peptidyl-prolyl cis-trans isomerase